MTQGTLITAPVLPSVRRPARRERSFVLRHLGALVLVAASVAIVVVVAAAPLIAHFSPIDVVGPARTAPNGTYWFGTDNLGRDVFSRTLFGGQQTLAIAAISIAVATFIGVLIGVVAGYFSGAGSMTLMRLMDVLLAFPTMLLALVVIAVAGSNAQTLTIAVAIAYIPTFARVVFGSTRRIRSEDYILAARVVGCSTLRILYNHVLRSLFVEIIILASSALGWAVLLAAGLSFLGFGVTPPDPEWGASLSAGTAYINNAFWMSAAPGVAITLVILITNLAGDRIAAWWQRTGR
ncbi:MAG: ABC-type transporter, integral rane subunit [Subtercola sp.]|nr:ABC-type transporter, integral rane subunit [Subtercola sp.]